MGVDRQPLVGGVDQGDLDGTDDAATLERAWRLVSRARNAVTLVRGKPSDQLPRDARERSTVAAMLGYSGPDELLNDYLRTTRHAKAVVDRVFWGE